MGRELLWGLAWPGKGCGAAWKLVPVEVAVPAAGLSPHPHAAAGSCLGRPLPPACPAAGLPSTQLSPPCPV